MAIVSCPECQKKLKVADTSVGKKVKCTCGQVFVAQTAEAVPLATPVAVSDKVVVACTECGAMLKVAATSLGKKMKCPKCASVFVAATEKARPPPPPAEDEPELMDETPAPKAKHASEEEDDLLMFAHSDAEENGAAQGEACGRRA